MFYHSRNTVLETKHGFHIFCSTYTNNYRMYTRDVNDFAATLPNQKTDE